MKGHSPQDLVRHMRMGSTVPPPTPHTHHANTPTIYTPTSTYSFSFSSCCVGSFGRERTFSFRKEDVVDWILRNSSSWRGPGGSLPSSLAPRFLIRLAMELRLSPFFSSFTRTSSASRSEYVLSPDLPQKINK
ncbi:hypothetical protein E2C01_011562 [Portunus trituberculatus]|uniref:Uncharacterized protein n=1 Tax=Portunus trituberculatus TaxID=210409 RepID=A0A5B7DBC2_PORTR|nr:hypothetical protein [Portunus trituberculatus]